MKFLAKDYLVFTNKIDVQQTPPILKHHLTTTRTSHLHPVKPLMPQIGTCNINNVRMITYFVCTAHQLQKGHW